MTSLVVFRSVDRPELELEEDDVALCKRLAEAASGTPGRPEKWFANNRRSPRPAA